MLWGGRYSAKAADGGANAALTVGIHWTFTAIRCTRRRYGIDQPGGGGAAITGDLVMTGSEVNPVVATNNNTEQHGGGGLMTIIDVEPAPD
jgi:hypothetical protein